MGMGMLEHRWGGRSFCCLRAAVASVCVYIYIWVKARNKTEECQPYIFGRTSLGWLFWCLWRCSNSQCFATLLGMI